MLSYIQVAILFCAIWITWWAIKRLLNHMAVKSILDNKICIGCLKDYELKYDVAWLVRDETGEMPLCDRCKKLEFPGELGEYAEKTGMLRRNNGN